MTMTPTIFQAPGSGAAGTTPQIRPRVAILWNGVLLEELGIADMLKSADLTLTLGRTNPSPKHPTGKPKVGGATVVFLIPDEAAGLKLRGLLYQDQRPHLTIGFGYHDGPAYWLGEANIRRRPDMKKFAVVRGYKIDTVAWEYGSNYPTLTLNGMAGKTLGLVEHRRPTVWTKTSLAKIAEGIADEHGVTLRISGTIPADHRIEYALQAAGESRFDVLQRLAEQYGASIHVTTMVASAVPGASLGYKYVFEGREGPSEMLGADQATVRTVLTIKSIAEDFVDISGLEQTRDIRIGWAPHLSPAKFHPAGTSVRSSMQAGSSVRSEMLNGTGAPDYLAQKISVAEDNVSRGTPTSGGVSKKGGVDTGRESKSGNVMKSVVELVTMPMQFVGGDVTREALGFEVAPDTKQSDKGDGTSAKTSVVPLPALPGDLGGPKLTAAQAQSVMVSHGIKSRITIDLCPGAPAIEPGATILVIGTYTHDGRYGVEEARNSYDDKGLRTTLTARPILAESAGGQGGKGKGGTAQTQAQKDKAAKPAEMIKNSEFIGSAVSVGSLDFEVFPDKTEEPGTVEGMVTTDPVPAAPPGGSAALEREITEAAP